MLTTPPTPMPNDATELFTTSSGNTNPSITYHAPRQNVATPAATPICVGIILKGTAAKLAAMSCSSWFPPAEEEVPLVAFEKDRAFWRKGPAELPHTRYKGAELEADAVDVARPEVCADFTTNLQASEARRITLP